MLVNPRYAHLLIEWHGNGWNVGVDGGAAPRASRRLLPAVDQAMRDGRGVVDAKDSVWAARIELPPDLVDALDSLLDGPREAGALGRLLASGIEVEDLGWIMGMAQLGRVTIRVPGAEPAEPTPHRHPAPCVAVPLRSVEGPGSRPWQSSSRPS